jgi:hypothetical protein
VVDPRTQLRLNPGIRAPYSDEYSIGIDREVGRQFAATAAYVRKQGANYIGYEEVGGQYSQQTRALPDGSSVPVLVLVNGTASRRFLLTNPAGYSLTYNGLVTTVEKRHSHGLACARLVHVLEGRGPAGIQWNSAQRRAAQYPDVQRFVRTRSEQSHQRPRPAGQRSPAHAAGHGSLDVPRTGVCDRGQRSVLQRQTVGCEHAAVAAARRSAHPPRAAGIAAALVAVTG